VARRYDTALAGIDALESNRADVKIHQRAGLPEQTVFPEYGDTANLEIGPETKLHILRCGAGEPGADRRQRRRADHRWSRGVCVVGEAGPRVLPDRDRKAKKSAQPRRHRFEIPVEAEALRRARP